MKKHRLSATLVALLLTVYSVQGHGMAFTDKTAFLNALPGPAGILHFESLAGGTPLSGTTQLVSDVPGTGITFPVVDDILGNPGDKLNLVVVTDNGNNPTTTELNSLGTSDTGNYNAIVAGTEITFGLTGLVNAFGLAFIAPAADVQNGDIHLVAGSITAVLDVSKGQFLKTVGAGDYYAYFLGVIDNTGFSSASIQYGPNSAGAFLYNIDDLTVATAATGISEPGTPVLFLGGLLAVLVWWGRGKLPVTAPT